MAAPSLKLITFLAFLVALTAVFATPVPFEDRSLGRDGLDYSRGNRTKFGGAAIVDLDRDGLPDMLFSHHGERVELYFNEGDFKFTKSPWYLRLDAHAFNPFRFLKWQRQPYFTLSRGGANGLRPNPPEVFRVSRARTLTQVTTNLGLESSAGRGRSSIYLPLNPRRPTRYDAIFLNAKPNDPTLEQHIAFRTRGMSFAPKNLTGFDNNNYFATVTDVDNDGKLEILSFEDLCMHNVTGDFELEDISGDVFPSGIDTRGVVAVAEFDYDNDGDMDLYIARSSRELTEWLKRRFPLPRDYLLRNDNGKYVDVTASAGITQGFQTRGVSPGDFNNDGYIDLLITRHVDETDVLLINNGDGTFTEHDAELGRPMNIPGDQPMAVDLDRDGRLDAVLSQGSWKTFALGNQYRVMKNVMNSTNGHVLVQVGQAPSRGATSMHAMVRLRIGDVTQMRRVGTPGVAASNSYIELVHFGVGNASMVDEVWVTWYDGSVERRTDVMPGSPSSPLVMVFGRP